MQVNTKGKQESVMKFEKIILMRKARDLLRAGGSAGYLP